MGPDTDKRIPVTRSKDYKDQGTTNISKRSAQQLFIDVFIGWLDREHDARVLANSYLFKIAEERQNGLLFPREMSKFVDGVEIPVHIIGDAAYLLRRWLLKGYSQQVQLSLENIHYTHALSSAQMVVENAFGWLKGLWHYLLKHNDVDIYFVTDVVAARCVLRNICEMQRDQYLPEWDVLEEPVGSDPVPLTTPSFGQSAQSTKEN
ncbi:uncharacterized protein LOC134934635 [Pseudophryne corroboree]|uniref:uncharacterized protein LOC134934635 n=1 Tax=Pseudophryne corroboree TaxID=495146 RepID=UPI0030819DF2